MATQRKIYKYTSLEAAIAILKSGGVALSNPAVFNDPNDCSFTQSERDKKNIRNLTHDYFFYRILMDLVASSDAKLSKRDKGLIRFLQWEMRFMRVIMSKSPYFMRIPGFSFLCKLLSRKYQFVKDKLEDADADFQKTMDLAVEKTKGAALITCFSKRNNSILMWSHYANSHKGVCIEYDRPNSGHFKDVTYVNKRPSFELYKTVSHVLALDALGKEETTEEISSQLQGVLDPFFVKSTDWKYEEEVRYLCSKSRLSDNIVFDVDCNRYVLKMELPTAIYVGCNASGDELNHLFELAQHRNIPVIFMKKSLDTFDVVADGQRQFVPEDRKRPQNITLLKLISDIDGCVNNGLFLAGFAASLVVPAICGQVECKDIDDPKKRYIEWCNTYLPCASRGPDSEGMAFITGEILWNIKDRVFAYGNTDVYGHYEDFELNKLTLRIEKRKGFDIYCELLGEKDVTLNVTKFCADMLFQAKRCYREHSEDIASLKQIPIEDYDADLESMLECAILSDRLTKGIKK